MRILLVHDDPNGLERLRRSLLEHERDWETRLAPDHEAALVTLHAWQPDAVVAPARGKGLDGIQLLTAIRDCRPETVRIVVGGPADSDHVLRTLKVAHRALPDPCESKTLIEALRRALMLRDLVSQPKMRALLGHLGPLPPAPIVYTELTRRLEDPSVSVSELALLIAEDPSLAAQVLRIANSAYFGRDKAVTRIVDAAARVGTRLLRGLVLTAELYGRFPTTRAVADQIEEVQRHSALVARIASGLEPRAAWREDAFTGGLLHDIGKVVLLSRMPDTALAIVHEAVESGRDEFHVEMERLGTHHGTLGACLLGMWGLPSMLLECVHGHHDLSLDIPHTLNAVRAVALADRLAHDVTDSEEAQLRREPLPVAILTDPRWSWWREMADQIAHEGSAV